MNEAKVIVEFLPPADKYFKSIKKDKALVKKFEKMIQELGNNPFIGTKNTGDLASVYSVDFRYNKTTYELAYSIITTENITIVLIMAGPRENFL